MCTSWDTHAAVEISSFLGSSLIADVLAKGSLVRHWLRRTDRKSSARADSRGTGSRVTGTGTV